MKPIPIHDLINKLHEVIDTLSEAKEVPLDSYDEPWRIKQIGSYIVEERKGKDGKVYIRSIYKPDEVVEYSGGELKEYTPTNQEAELAKEVTCLTSELERVALLHADAAGALWSIKKIIDEWTKR